MALPKLYLTPLQAGYSIDYGNEVISVSLAGGASRFRRDILDAHSVVSVQWRLSKTDYQYLMAFYRTQLEGGSLAFNIDLILNDVELAEYEAHFVPGSVNLSSTQGHTFTVSANLEVKPNAADTDYDEALVMLFNEYGDDVVARDTLLQLEQLVNVDFVGSL